MLRFELIMKTAFKQHWDEAIASCTDKSRYEIIEIGWEQHVLVDHHENIVYRYPRRKNAADKLEDEVELLKSLQGYRLPLKIPLMRSHTSDFASYDYIEGEVLSEDMISRLSPEDFTDIGENLGKFLSELHKVDKRVVGNKKTKQTTTLLEYYEKRILSAKDKSEYFSEAKSDLDKLVSDPKPTQVVVHGDLHGLNMVINPDTKKLVGIIDFSEVELGDPNQDFRKIFMADARFLKPAIISYNLAGNEILSEDRIKLWAYVNEWANLCHFHDSPASATYNRAKNHLRKWGKI